ncbi:MAG: NAD(P)H-dependent oxidoreductase [Bdellovibrionaceae bacterium]|nr:NAD(P)H-dependent oxidoreductase [Bdellovibrio sp.]
MSKVANEVIHRQLNWRYACKKFDPTKKINEADLNILLESMRLSASSYGLQPWKFIVIQNPEIRKKLLPLSWNQSPVVEASHLVVLTYKEKMDEPFIDRHMQQTAKVREVEVASLARLKTSIMGDLVNGARSEVINWWAQRQTYLAMGSFLITAALMEIDSLPMEGLDPIGYDEVLKLEGTGFKTLAAIAFGYRAADDKYQHIKKVRFDLADVVEIR